MNSSLLVCSICLENIKDNVKFQCEHEYCKKCIDKWLVLNNYTCPICRQDIKNITYKNKTYSIISYLNKDNTCVAFQKICSLIFFFTFIYYIYFVIIYD